MAKLCPTTIESINIGLHIEIGRYCLLIFSWVIIKRGGVLQSLVVGVGREEGLDVVDDGVVSLEFVEIKALELSVGDG